MGEKASVPELQLSFTNWLEREGRSSASAFHFAEKVCKSGANADIFKVVEQRLCPATGAFLLSSFAHAALRLFSRLNY